MSANLRPCPFCGQHALLDEHPAHSHAGGIAGFMPDYPGSFTIECMGKGCNTGQIADTLDEVVAMWNRRAAPAAVETPAAQAPILQERFHHAAWALKQIADLQPDQGGTAVFMARTWIDGTSPAFRRVLAGWGASVAAKAIA